jgi:oligopeptide/dipeptide ABC transporter ATP-binding protein
MSATQTSPTGRYRPSSGHMGSRRLRPAAPAATVRPTAPGSAAPTPPRSAGQGNVVLEVQDLRTYFFTYDGVVRALEGVNLQVRAGETTGIVGETGCGKSVTAFSINRLVAEPGRVISGKIMFQGADLLWGLDKEARYVRPKGGGRVKVHRSFRRIKAANERLAAVRGRGIGMVFQEPGQAMNPVFSIADQLGEALQIHRGIEIIDGLLAADAKAVASGYTDTPDIGPEPVAEGETAPVTVAPAGTIDHLLQVAATGSRAELREAANAMAETIGLPSLGAELFYTLYTAGPAAYKRHARIARLLRRPRLTARQRSYLRHMRRVYVHQQTIKDLYFKEMKIGKSQAGGRSRAGFRIRLENLTHFYFGLPGLGRQVEKPLKTEVFWRVVQMLEGVQIANPVQVARGYPHELSGGMLQRAMIAMALACEPALLIADEPTTALDVTIQAQILELMRLLRDRVGTAIVLITHDLGVVAEVCDHVNVMYAGLIIESGPVQEVFRRPLHPYTQGLLASIPRFDQPDKELQSIAGSVPNLIHPPPGCRFHPRCPYAMPVCKEVRPLPQIEGESHMVACHLYSEGATAPPPAKAPA